MITGLTHTMLFVSLRGAVDRNAMSGGVFAADDCRQTYEDLRGEGAKCVSPPQQPYGVEAIFKDGCGNWFSLRQALR